MPNMATVKVQNKGVSEGSDGSEIWIPIPILTNRTCPECATPGLYMHHDSPLASGISWASAVAYK